MTDTRAKMLQAGVLLFSRLRRSHLENLTAGRVAEAAGFHRQTFYRYWETQADYIRDLVRFALGGENDPTVEGIRAAVGGGPVPSEFESFVRAVARHEFARFTSDPMREFRFGLIATRGGPEEIDDLVDDFAGRVMSEATDGLNGLLRAWSREPTDPYTTRDIALAVEALAIGLSIAEAFVAESVAAGLYEQVIVDLLLTMTRPRAE